MGKILDTLKQEFDENIRPESFDILFMIEDLINEAAKDFPYSTTTNERDLLASRHLWFCKWIENRA